MVKLVVGCGSEWVLGWVLVYAGWGWGVLWCGWGKADGRGEMWVRCRWIKVKVNFLIYIADRKATTCI